MEQLAQVNDFALAKLMEYLGNLDWGYMITLILLSHFVCRNEMLDNKFIAQLTWLKKVKTLLLAIPMAWRVLLMGVIYGMVLYWIRDYSGKNWLENMVQSLIFAMVSHKLFLEKWLNKLDAKLFNKQ